MRKQARSRSSPFVTSNATSSALPSLEQKPAAIHHANTCRGWQQPRSWQLGSSCVLFCISRGTQRFPELPRGRASDQLSSTGTNFEEIPPSPKATSLRQVTTSFPRGQLITTDRTPLCARASAPAGAELRRSSTGMKQSIRRAISMKEFTVHSVQQSIREIVLRERLLADSRPHLLFSPTLFLSTVDPESARAETRSHRD